MDPQGARSATRLETETHLASLSLARYALWIARVGGDSNNGRASSNIFGFGKFNRPALMGSRKPASGLPEVKGLVRLELRVWRG